MKKRKIISAAAAVMMAAVTLAPQLPSAFPAARICTPITAEAAKNEVRIKVVDMATDMPIENVDAAASTVKDFSREDSSFSWNTSDAVEFPIEGAYNNDWYVKLYNVPEEYNYNAVYTIDRDTRTYGDYTIRLVKKSQDNNVTICSAHDEPVAKVLLKTADMDVYDKKDNWFCTIKSNEGTYLPDGEYSVKFKENVLVNSGVCVKGEASQKLTIKDGVPTDTIFFLLASDERKEPNVSFTIKNEGEDTSSADGLGRVVITGDGFTLDTDGSAYLGDGHYTAHRYNFPKNGFNQTGNKERDQHNIDIIADSLLNKTEDIEFNVVDGKPDRDLVFVKVPVNRPAEEEGATAKIKVVDKATGKNIEGVDVEVIAGINATGKSLAKWNTSDEEEKVLTGLSGNPNLAFGIDLSNVPEEYDFQKRYIFGFAKDSKEESWVVELEKKNGPVAEEGATAKIKVVDKATGKNIEGIDVVAISGLNATAKSIAKWNTSDEAEKIIKGLAGDSRIVYGIELSNVPKEYEYNKQYIFSFAKDSKEESWVVELEKKNGPVAEKDDIGFRLYSRYKGLWDRKDNGMVGYVIITDGADDFIGKYKLDEMISLPDGKYKAEIEVNSKGYSCFSEQKIQFTVDEGKAVENLDFNVERWNFNENGSGDANGDGTVDISDAVLIMQSMANPSKYGANGTDKGHLTEDGSKRADVDGGGVTNKDALTIQQYLLGMFNYE